MTCGMKNKKRNWSWLLPVALIIAVLISIIFTALIWVTPSHFQVFGSKSAPAAGSVDKNVAGKQSITDVYLPVSLTYYENDTRYQLSSTKIDVIDLVRRRVKNVRIKKITKETFRSQEEYLKFLNMNDSYSLNYSAPVTLGLFKNHMKSMTKSDANYAFSRILVPLNRRGVIYFMDDHSLNVYTARINVQAIGKMSSLITRRDIKMVRVEYRLFNGHITKYFLQPIEVPKSSYLINRENTGLFVTRLIGSNENSSVTTREQKKQTIYTDDAGQRMVIKNHNGYVSYTNYAKEIAEARHRSLYDSLNLSFDRLKLLDVALDDVRYSEFDFQSKNATYRSYINGFPIISADEYGSYQVQITDSGNQHLVFSLYTLQVPVPADLNAVQLPNTDDVMESLKQSGIDMQKINNVQIGYRESKNESSALVIDLTPTYFVKYNNVWIDYRDLVHNEGGSR